MINLKMSVEQNPFTLWRESTEKFGGDNISRVSTGFPALNGLLNGGFKPQNLYLVGSRSGVGQSIFASNLAAAAAKNEKRVIYFSIEMAAKEIACRILASEARIPVEKIENFTLCSVDEQERFYLAVLTCEKLNLDIIDTSLLTIADIMCYVHREQAVHGVDLVIIDNLNLIASEKPCEGQTEKIGYIADGLIAIAKNMGIPVVALAQLERDVSSTQDQPPTLGSLPGRGRLEQAAEVVILLHRASDSDSDKKSDCMQVLVAKNRSGRVGEVEMRFRPNIAKISEVLGPYEPSLFSSHRAHYRAQQYKDDDSLVIFKG